VTLMSDQTPPARPSARSPTPTTAAGPATPPRRPPGCRRAAVTVLELGAGTGKLTARWSRSATTCTPPTPTTQMLAHPDASSPTSDRGRRPRTSRSPTRRRRGRRGAGVPLVRPRPGAPRDRPGAQARRPPGLGVEPARRADPVGRRSSADHRHQEHSRSRRAARPVAAVRLRRGRVVPHWQVDRPRVDPGPGALPLERRGARRRGRAAKLAEVLAFYDDYGRGMDGMLLPYVTRCFRAVVVDRPRRADVVPPADPGDGDDAGPG
jgi:hypothetical protein